MSDAEWRVPVPAPSSTTFALPSTGRFGVAGDMAIGIALAAGSGPLWAELSLVREGRQRLEAALARVDAQTSVPDQARLARALGSLWRRRRHRRCQRGNERSSCTVASTIRKDSAFRSRSGELR